MRQKLTENFKTSSGAAARDVSPTKTMIVTIVILSMLLGAALFALFSKPASVTPSAASLTSLADNESPSIATIDVKAKGIDVEFASIRDWIAIAFEEMLGRQ